MNPASCLKSVPRPLYAKFSQRTYSRLSVDQNFQLASKRPQPKAVPSSNSAFRDLSSFSSSMAPVATATENGDNPSELEKVAVIGSGNWGSCIARIAGMNAKANPHKFHRKVTMWVNQEQYEGRFLTDIINERHQNPRYLPGIDLGDNVYAEPDIEKAISDATALIVVLPHQFLSGVLKRLAGKVRPDARAVTLIKGIFVHEKEISSFASLIQRELGIPCAALSGANIANEVAADLYSESTLGIPTAEEGSTSSYADLLKRPEVQLWKTLFETPTFRIRVVEDVEGVCLCGALKNVVALAAGFVDGLGWGDNAKAAVMRIGLMEIHDFCLEFFPTTRSPTFLQESCGVADIMTSCMGGRNRKVAMEMVKTGKSFQELETELLNGQKLQGPQTADEVRELLDARGVDKTKYALFDNVWKICYQGMSPKDITKGL
ncbi:glycerol-3-phosphate dehydrogenase [Tulasnella sp. 418]|nr:glycerol-3-phosphate dehydrogenase [Tulasnella sp. 418]